MRKLISQLRLGREEGQVLPMLAFAFIGILLMTGVVIDGGNLFQNKQSLQNAADAAALAAAQYEADPTKPCVTGAADQIASCAGNYALRNSANGPNGDSSDPTKCVNGVDPADPCALPACDQTHPAAPLYVTDTQGPSKAPGCYVKDYPKPGEVEVWLTRNTSNGFGGLVGLATSKESARAIGQLQPGNPPPITFAALNNSCDNHTLLIRSSGNLTVDSGIYVNSCSGHDGFDVFAANTTTPGSIKAAKIITNGGWEVDKGTGVYVGPFPNPPECVLTSPYSPGGGKVGFSPPTTGNGCPITGVTGCPTGGAVCDPFAAFPPVPDLQAGNVGAPMSILRIKRTSAVATAVVAGNQTNLNGSSVSIFNVGFGFDGNNFNVTSATYSAQSDTTSFTYANTGTDLPVIQRKQMSGGVATLTANAPTTLAVGENDLAVLGLPGFNVSGATVTGTGSSSFSYQPPPFTLSITKKQLQSGTATLTAGSTAGLDAGDTVNISGVGPQFDGVGQIVTDVPNGTTFTYADAATTSLTVTQKAAAHGVATLTAANNLSVGDKVTVNIGDFRFDGGPFTVTAAAAGQFSYADPNLGTMDITPTNKAMTAGVATITVPNHLAVGESVTVNIPDVNYAGGPYTVSGATGNNFQYTPAVPVPLATGSIANKLATVSTAPVAHKLTVGDDVKVSGDEAYAFTGNGSNIDSVSTPTPAGTSFTYTPTPIASVAWNVTSSTSATFTTDGTHDTNITSITIGGAGAALNKNFNGANLSVTGNTFTVKGTGFPTGAGSTGTNATVTIVTAGATTFSGALATQETAWDLASRSAGGTVTVPLFLAATAASGTVTAPGYVAANTAVSPAGSATVTDVPSLGASGTFTPAWMPTFGVVGQNFPGSPGIPAPLLVNQDTTLGPNTYYGGICIGAGSFSDCKNTANTKHCLAAGGTTTITQPYTPEVDLFADVTGDDTSPNYNTVLVKPASTIAPGDLIAIDNEDMLVNPNGVSVNPNTGVATLTVTREANGTEAAAHTAVPTTQVYHLITQPNGTPYTPAKKITANINATVTSIPVNSTTPNPIGVGDIIQIDSEAMTVTAIPDGTHLTVTRATYNTTAATHAGNAPILKVFDASAPAPPTVTLSKGVYIMAGGGFSVCGAANVNAPAGVMIYNTIDYSNPVGAGALGQVDINTAGNVHLKPMPDGTYAGMTIFQDRSQTLVPGTSCDKKGSSSTAYQWDIAFSSAAPLGSNGALASVTGTIYAPNTRADFGDSMSGTSNLAVITSCIFIDGATSRFNHVITPVGQLFGVSAALGG